jgi:ketose-bisphosphate aldolase
MYLNIMDYLNDAYHNGYAIPAFDYSCIWDAAAIVRAAEEERSPVILMTIAAMDAMIPVFLQGSMLRTMADQAAVPVFLHIDHATEYGICERAILTGYDSVMIDASKYSLEENIAKTMAVADFAHRNGTAVEAEIGRIKGKNSEGSFVGEDYLVKTIDAVNLVKNTGVDFLAVGVGNAHGFYTEEPKINQERLSEVNKALGIPLVMHGGTGIPKEMMRESIHNGIAKVNVGTDIVTSYASFIFKKMEESRGNSSIIPGIAGAMDAVKEVARNWIRVCMSDGKIC